MRKSSLALLAALMGLVAPLFADTTISGPATYTTPVENGSGDNFSITGTGDLTNESQLTNDVGGQMDNAGVLSNTAGADVFNYGGFVNENAGGITNNGIVVNEAGASLSNTAGGVINSDNPFFNVGFLYNAGSLSSDGSLENDGLLDNAGTLSNTAGVLFFNYGGFVNDNGGGTANNGNFYNESGASLTNTAGGAITNNVYFENDGFLDNAGAFSSDETLVNYGFFDNAGALSNAVGASFYIYGGLVNDGAGVITNNGTVDNEIGASLTNTAGGAITNIGAFENGGFLDNAGALSNTAAGVFENAAYSGLVNESAGSIINNGSFSNDTGASLTNTAGGIITNNEIFLNYGFFRNEGTFADGTFSNLENQGGTFVNVGTFSGGQLSNESGGTLVNGGPLNVSDFTQDASSSLVVELSPKAAAGLTVVDDADLAGTLKLVYAPGVYTNRSYTLLTAANISGTFSALEQSSPYATGTLEYLLDPAVVLEVTSLEVSPDNDSVFGALGNLALVGAQRSEEGLLARLDGLDADAAGKTGAWEENTGYSYRMDGNGPVAGYGAQGGGLAAGMDQRWGRDIDGFAFSDGATGVRLADGENGSVADPGANVYGGLGLGPVDLEAALGFAYEEYSAARPIASVGQTASSSYGGPELSAALKAELPWEALGLSVSPSLGLDCARVETGSFTESGAEYFNMAVAGNVVQELAPSVGLSVEKGFTLGSWQLRPSLAGRWSYEVLDQDLAGTASVGGENFTLQALSPSPGILTLGGGLEAQVTGTFSLQASYQVAPTGNALAQSLSLGLKYYFGT